MVHFFSIPTANDVADWPPVNDGKTTILYNDKTPSLGSWPYSERYQLWDDMFPISKNSMGRNLPTLMGVLALLLLLWKLS